MWNGFAGVASSVEPDHVEMKTLADADGSVAIVEKGTGEPVQYVRSDAVAKGLIAQWQLYFKNAFAKAKDGKHG